MAQKNTVVARLHSRVKSALEQSGLTRNKALIVAVSGGPDSLALLHSLHSLRDELGLRLHGAHLDHRLRGEASRADAHFVASVFANLGIGFTTEEADVYAFQNQHKLSLEEAAREVRYAFLASVSHEQRADAIALGHTADDQAETILMHIIRGAGLTGLRGMEATARRSFDGNEVTLVRPLLSVPRSDIEDYCRALGLEPRQDESNLSHEMTRNKVRLELIPSLTQYNPSIRDALLGLSRSAAQDIAYIEEEVDKVWQQTAKQIDDEVVLGIEEFRRLAPAIANHLLRRATLAVKGDLVDVGQSHIEDMARLMLGRAGTSLDLPGGLRFSVGYSDAMLTAMPHDTCPLPPLEGEHTLNIPGETLIDGWHVTAKLLSESKRRGAEDSHRSTEKGSSAEYTKILDFDSVGADLWVRPRIPGDRFQPLGMSQSKKLQDFMVDEKIPRAWRDRVPLVVSPTGIVWVVGWRIADWAKVSGNSAELLELCFTRI